MWGKRMIVDIILRFKSITVISESSGAALSKIHSGTCWFWSLCVCACVCAVREWCLNLYMYWTHFVMFRENYGNSDILLNFQYIKFHWMSPMGTHTHIHAHSMLSIHLISCWSNIVRGAYYVHVVTFPYNPMWFALIKIYKRYVTLEMMGGGFVCTVHERIANTNINPVK